MSDIERTPLLRAARKDRPSQADLITQDYQDEPAPVAVTLPEDGSAVENAQIPEASTLGRKIGWSSAYILIMSRVIGSGIFSMPGVILQNVGSPGLALLLWFVGALVAWAGLAISIEYGAMLPRSGGTKVYLEYTYRKPRFLASILVASHAVLLGFTASNCIVFAKYTIYALGTEPSDFAVKSLAVGLLSVVVVIHSCFYRTGIFLQNLLGWIKIVLTLVMIVTGIAVLFKPHETSTWTDAWANSNWEWNTLSTAFFKVLYSFTGLENLNNVLNEVKNPIRTVKSVGPVGLFTACIMYVLINIAYLSVVPLEEVKQSRELIAALFFDKLGFGHSVLPSMIALSAAGNVMVVTFSLARYNQEVAKQGFLPFARFLASNKPFNAPMGGFIMLYIPSILVITLPPSSTVYAFIADVEGYAGQFFALAIAAGLLLLRRKKPDLYRPFRAWLPAVWLRIFLCVLLIAAPLFPPTPGTGDVDFFYASYALLGISVSIIGVLYWFILVIVMPRYGGYRLDETQETLSDGSVITRLVKNKLRDNV